MLMHTGFAKNVETVLKHKANTSNWIKMMEIGKRCGCHQRPDRSFFVNGYQFPLCARCTGVLVGRLVGLVFPIKAKTEITISLMIFPAVIDGVTQLLGFQESNNKRRLFTGVLLGMGEISLLKRILEIVKKEVNHHDK